MPISRVRRVTIGSDLPVPVQCDGDPAGWTPADVHRVNEHRIFLWRIPFRTGRPAS
jgi:hypothetical protein